MGKYTVIMRGQWFQLELRPKGFEKDTENQMEKNMEPMNSGLV